MGRLHGSGIGGGEYLRHSGILRAGGFSVALAVVYRRPCVLAAAAANQGQRHQQEIRSPVGADGITVIQISATRQRNGGGVSGKGVRVGYDGGQVVRIIAGVYLPPGRAHLGVVVNGQRAEVGHHQNGLRQGGVAHHHIGAGAIARFLFLKCITVTARVDYGIGVGNAILQGVAVLVADVIGDRAAAVPAGRDGDRSGEIGGGWRNLGGVGLKGVNKLVGGAPAVVGLQGQGSAAITVHMNRAGVAVPVCPIQAVVDSASRRRQCDVHRIIVQTRGRAGGQRGHISVGVCNVLGRITGSGAHPNYGRGT